MWTEHRIEQFIERVIARLGAIEEALNKQGNATSNADKVAEEKWTEVPRIVARIATNTVDHILGTAEEREAERAEKEAADRQKNRQQRRLVASQVRLVVWTRRAFCAAAIYAGIAAIQGGLIHQTNSLTQQSLDKSDIHFRIEQRPWINSSATFAATVPDPRDKTKMIPGPAIRISPHTWQLKFAVVMENDGHSPAMEVSATPSEVILGPAEYARNKAKNYVPIYSDATGVLMTGKTGTVPTPPGPTFDEANYWSVGNRQWEIYIVGGIRYRDPFEPKIAPYETVYCFQYLPDGLPFGGCSFRPTVMK